MPDHHIEKQILNKLIYLGSASFGQLKPPELMNNAFNYHLKALVRDGLIEKSADEYRLTKEGLAYADKLSFKTNKPRQQPKIISMIVIRNSAGQYLLAKRKTEPFKGKLCFVSGKQHFGEAAESQVERELREQIGSAFKTTRRGLADIRINDGGQVVSHVLAHVYSGEFDGDAPAESQKFSYGWHDKSSLDDLLASDRAALETLDQAKEFVLSLDVDA